VNCVTVEPLVTSNGLRANKEEVFPRSRENISYVGIPSVHQGQGREGQWVEQNYFSHFSLREKDGSVVHSAYRE